LGFVFSATAYHWAIKSKPFSVGTGTNASRTTLKASTATSLGEATRSKV